MGWETFLFLEMRFYCIAQAGLKAVMLLSHFAALLRNTGEGTENDCLTFGKTKLVLR